MLTGLALLLRIVLILLLVRLVLRFVAAVIKGATSPAQPARAGTPELVRDPLCNTFVPRDRAVAGRFDGHDALFCSAACRDRAAALPR